MLLYWWQVTTGRRGGGEGREWGKKGEEKRVPATPMSNKKDVDEKANLKMYQQKRGLEDI